ncbi:hypothetical protein BST43_15635 [Mycobacteroides saopaulense]|uniref:Uncharacterized protein n=1 Tax=Mycobacteroides saopaulense TaxID=1578165 RepID=A0A1X0J0S9_9MYCO|nr:hypothetical protein BST43_15635 [Mycobacteroides saopaulense]
MLDGWSHLQSGRDTLDSVQASEDGRQFGAVIQVRGAFLLFRELPFPWCLGANRVRFGEPVRASGESLLETLGVQIGNEGRLNR